MSVALAKGFADPVFDSQRVFRAVMNAMARPGSVQPFETDLQPPLPLSAELAAVALALADPDAPLWLDPTLAAVQSVAPFLRFHTGAPIVTEPSAATFALVSDVSNMPPLASFAQGVPAFPDRSTTIVVAVGSLVSGAGGLILRGPGIADRAFLAAQPLPADFTEQWAGNRQQFPRGVDLVLVARGCVAALPRTTEIV